MTVNKLINITCVSRTRHKCSVDGFDLHESSEQGGNSNRQSIKT